MAPQMQNTDVSVQDYDKQLSLFKFWPKMTQKWPKLAKDAKYGHILPSVANFLPTCPTPLSDPPEHWLFRDPPPPWSLEVIQANNTNSTQEGALLEGSVPSIWDMFCGSVVLG